SYYIFIIYTHSLFFILSFSSLVFFFFFFLMIPRPPISTLFPYTTLFRSRPMIRHVGVLVVALSACAPQVTTRAPHFASAQVDRPDRKSTRLNSSHLVISDAVFCLKKKKKKKKNLDK